MFMCVLFYLGQLSHFLSCFGMAVRLSGLALHSTFQMPAAFEYR